MKFVKDVVSYVFIILLSLYTGAYAQYNKACKYYNKEEYNKAIPCFLKSVKKNEDSSIVAAVKLANCYRVIKDYKNAEKYYHLAVELGKVDPQVHFLYGTILKNNNKFEDALQEFNAYLKDHINEDLVRNEIISCNEIKIWKNKPIEYTVKPLDAINSKRSEFSPVIYENKLVFVSEQENDLVNFESKDFDGKPFLNVYYTELKNGNPIKINAFGEKINSSFHDGPVSFSPDLNTIYFTRVNCLINKRDKNFTNVSKIYFSKKEGKKWQDPVSFNCNSDTFSVAHPAVSPDGKYLFFAWNKSGPGTFGGYDLYVCEMENDKWSRPINLGPKINTAGNEVFPYIRKDGTLFFSSDGHPGFGGLDIFTAKNKYGVWKIVRNEGFGLNGYTDDFGICFNSDSTGYFSSDRLEGGMGKDDLYQFTFRNMYLTVEGFVLNSDDIDDVSANTRLLLNDENGNYLNSIRTDDRGYFIFDNLPAGKKYNVKIDEKDPNYHGQKRFYYADKDNKHVMQVSVTNENGDKFVFKNLPLDTNALPELKIEEDISIGGVLVTSDNSTPIVNVSLLVKNLKGNVIQQSTTNAFGAFVFNNLLLDDNFTIELAAASKQIPPGSKIILKDSKGKVIRVIVIDANGKFQIKMLEAESNLMQELEVKDEDLLMNISGKLLDQQKKKVPGVKIFLYDNYGNPIDSLLTDQQSSFEFKKLSTNENYTLSIDAKNKQLEGMNKLYLISNNGNAEKEVIKDANGEFKMRILKTEQNEMKEMYVDDPWLEVLDFKNSKSGNKEITITESVYYASGDYRFHESGKLVLDKIAKIMLDNKDLQLEVISHTDSKADDNYNLKLSQKRAATVVEYILVKGINKKRLKATGLGETKLINKCGNNVQCTDEEHAKNRRTEFKVVHFVN